MPIIPLSLVFLCIYNLVIFALGRTNWNHMKAFSPIKFMYLLFCLNNLRSTVMFYWHIPNVEGTNEDARMLIDAYHYNNCYSFETFSHQRKLMVFHKSLSDSKSPQVYRTLLSILTDHTNAVVWIVSTCPLTSKFYIPFTNTLEIVPSTRFTIGITVTFNAP